MPRNVEIKARVTDRERLTVRVEALATDGPTAFRQDDTFFGCSAGRLKLRTVDGAGELIYYRRADRTDPRESFYLLTPVDAPDAMRDLLEAAHGIVGRVRKHRTLYRIGCTRVHLDVVDGLGEFVELEVELADGDTEANGVAEARRLADALGIAESDLVRDAYVDLLAPEPPPRA